jgi:RNase P subunit RPR2
MQTQTVRSQTQDFETSETHYCVGCGAPAKLTRKERGEHGGYYLTFTCARCGTKEMIKSAGVPRAENAVGLRRH